jgi:hypothetical protein
MKKFLSLVGILLFSTGLYSEQNPRTTSIGFRLFLH